jgi:hypothetical protein
MNRRDFVSRAALGAAAACTSVAGNAFAASSSGSFKFRFVGMMAFIERQDRSFLVATPGDSHHQAAHLPFLMARADSVFAKAFNMKRVSGVIPEAFDTELVGTKPDDFVYRSLENTSIEVVSGESDPVANSATQMAHLHRIAPGKRVRGNVERWASATVDLRGGRIENSAAHPDAGRFWSFGSHRQQLTDAVNYHNAAAAATAVRLTSGTEVVTVSIGAGQAAELSLISAAAFAARMNNPAKLIHSGLLFEYLVDAQPVIAECPDATGREVPSTALPFSKPSSAGIGIVGREATFPPATDFCYICDILLGGSS